MTITVAQSALSGFPTIPQAPDDVEPNPSELPPVWEAPDDWGVTLTFTALVDDGTGNMVSRPIDSIAVRQEPSNTNWLFNFGPTVSNQTANSFRLNGPVMAVFLDAAYTFTLEHKPAEFAVIDGKVVEVEQKPGPNENDPNAIIPDEDFVYPPRPFGAVEIIDTGEFSEPSDPSFPKGIVAISLPRYFQRKLLPTTQLPWLAFVSYGAPTVKETTKSFTVDVTYKNLANQDVTESITLSQDIYWNYDRVIDIIRAIAETPREI